MTNGEKIKEIFPNIEFTDMAFTVHAVAEVTSTRVKGKICYDFWKDWWNTEYKEPTIKNDKIDCDNTDCNNCVNHKYCDYETTSSEKPNKSIEEKCPCYDCEYFEKEGLSHCKIYEGTYGDCRCNNYHKVNQTTTKKCTTCAYREIDGKPHEMCKSCVCGNRYKQEPTTKNDLGVDCISREDALMCLTGKFEIRGYEPSELVSIFSKRIKALPSVTLQEPIRPKGRWISYHYGAYYECSNCHERNNSRYDKYCKFCGAEMDEVEE